jgi:hypothetical protein
MFRCLHKLHNVGSTAPVTPVAYVLATLSSGSVITVIISLHPTTKPGI